MSISVMEYGCGTVSGAASQWVQSCSVYTPKTEVVLNFLSPLLLALIIVGAVIIVVKVICDTVEYCATEQTIRETGEGPSDFMEFVGDDPDK